MFLYKPQEVQHMLCEAASLVRQYQLGLRVIGEASLKADETLLTKADRETGNLLLTRIKSQWPDVACNIEDAGGTSGITSDIIFYGDPIDGTLPFTVGLPTSTVIVGIYERPIEKIRECAIAEPISGRLWFTEDGKTWYAVIDNKGYTTITSRQVTTWQGTLGRATAVFLDSPQGFTRSGRQIMNDTQVQKLLCNLSQYRLLMTGSNGLHQAVTAQGHDKMAGGITTAIGGPQDVVGIRLVLNAGGAAHAFRVHDSTHTLIEVSAQAIESFDMVVYGNTTVTVDQLVADLKNAWEYRPSA